MSKVKEIMESGDTHLIAKVRLRRFFGEMERDFPVKLESTSQGGIMVYVSSQVDEWLEKWFGELK